MNYFENMEGHDRLFLLMWFFVLVILFSLIITDYIIESKAIDKGMIKTYHDGKYIWIKPQELKYLEKERK